MLDLNQIRYPVRYTTFFLALGGLIFSALVVLASGQAWIMLLLFAALSAVGVHDVLQTRHAILRNYPILGHMRFLLEFIRPEIRQYFIENESEAAPFFTCPTKFGVCACQGPIRQTAVWYPTRCRPSRV